jgi:tRNA A-37 threonylcarbamoyl transferase component Bud32
MKYYSLFVVCTVMSSSTVARAINVDPNHSQGGTTAQSQAGTSPTGPNSKSAGSAGTAAAVAANAFIGGPDSNDMLGGKGSGATQPTGQTDVANAPSTDATGMTPAAVQQQYQAFGQAGDWKSAAALAQSALAQNPGDQNLQALAQQAQLRAKTETTVNQRAQELIAGLRGDAGDLPPGSAIAASPLPMASLVTAAPRGGASPASLLASGLSGRDPAFAHADGLVRQAAVKLGLKDFADAEDLLTKRLAVDPADEPALRLRALARRWMKRFEPSSRDARSALALKPGDSGARAVLVDDLVDLGRSKDALDAADEALAANPRDARVLAARADAWASLGDRERQLADLKAAADADAQFDALYRQALSGGASTLRRGPGSFLLWLGAIGTALLFFSFALFRRRGDSSVRVPMRAEDRAHLARAAAPALAPQGFRIERTLGEGGMGVVYEAVDLALQRPVALKKLRAEIADAPRERARFLKEARTVAALRHPNIVAIHSIHEDAQGLFLVFEKVAGQTLHERLSAGGLMPAETVDYLRQVAKALDYAHSQGVVHQDLKPANVMVSNGEAKVMDFGIARRVAETLSTMSKIEISGTPVYMAPEQEFGQHVGPAADVYALGICAYELLTGKRPFPVGGLMMKTRALYRPASESGVAAAADAVIARALAPEPGARWPSASSFVEALSRSLAVASPS